MALVAVLFAGNAVAADAARPPLKVGVTLHPYYSWTANVVGSTGVEVRAILPGDVDAGNYQPAVADIEKIRDLDAIVVNGVGHDDFIMPMIEASGNKTITIIRPNDGAPLLRALNGGTVNSHTFISFTNAIQQSYAIAKALGALRPELAQAFLENASAYARRLRAIKADAVGKLAAARISRVVTVHDGYGYLMQELGIDIAGVVEPSHGLVPSALELQGIVELCKKEKITVVFTEESFPAPLLNVLRESAGARTYVISHIATGTYSADRFEKDMKTNADTVVQALVTDAAAK